MPILFTIPTDAKCHLDQATVSSALLDKSKGDKKETDEHHLAHNDIDASWAFTCQSVKNLDQITLHFFTVFSHGFKKLKVDWLTSKGASSDLITEDKTINLK